MGSNTSSNSPPQETQSAPVTARSTPNPPKRNRQFQEVQLGQTGDKTPRSRQQTRTQGASPKPSQSTSQSTHGQDPGASGGGSDRRQQPAQQQTPRQGAAANGGKPGKPQGKKTTMPSQQSAVKVKESGNHDNQVSAPINDDPNDLMVNDLVSPDKKKTLTANRGHVNGFHGTGTSKRNEIFGGRDSVNPGTNVKKKISFANNASGQLDKGPNTTGEVRKESHKTVSFNENVTSVKSSISKKKKEDSKISENIANGIQDAKLKSRKHVTITEEPKDGPLSSESYGEKKHAGKTNDNTYDENKKFENSVSDKKNNAKQDEILKPESSVLDRNKTSSVKHEEMTKSQIVSSIKSVKFKDEGKNTVITAASTKDKNKLNSSISKKEIIINPVHNNRELDEDNISYDRGSEFDDAAQHYDGEVDDVNGTHGNHSHFYDGGSVGDMSEDEGGAADNDENAEVLSMKDDDLVFETFYHRSGKEFQCIYQSGMRFYLDDWGSKEWQPFPKRWYNEGLLVTNTILKDDSSNDQATNDQAAGASGQGQSTSRSQGRSSGGGGGSGNSDDREGFLMHPSRGRIPTYIFYKKHNVHMYFDKDTGSWVRLPIGWELHHTMVKNLVDQVEEAVPAWHDRHDILALLRACNYDPDECISIYLHLEKDEWFKAPRTAKEGKALVEKENRVSELEKKVRDLEIELQKERTQREESERNLEEQTTVMSEMEAESKQTEAQLSAMTGGRPKSARPVSRMIKAGKGPTGKKGGRPTPIGETVNPDDIQDLNANAMELRKTHTRLKMEVERYLGDFKHIIEKVGPAMKQLKSSEKGTQNEIEEVRALYRKEALQRKLLYNQLQELRGNIRVFCRVRKDDRGDCCIKFPSDQDMIAIHPQQGKKMFNFDKVFDMNSTQEQVFEDTKPIITSCVDGYNVCLLAYGQTGSGKTFTMMGPDSNPGINIRAMKELFQVCEERKETMKYNLTVSLVEIYNETLLDLLTNDAKALELRTAGNKVNIPGLIEYPIKNVDDVKKVMAMGDQNRSVASTKMNSVSSRSHLVLMLAVEGHDKVTSAITRGTLVLCDLAGSERISKTEAEGQRLVEAAAINKSLSALGQVFSALRSSQLHIPYRNSKLTQILQPSLGGDAKACLFVNVSPDVYNYLETVSTLTFGNNARQVALGQAKQNISKGNR